ncbi:MAG: beta-ketoacyl-[acyl-carrier-protein] synthase family protein [Pirellulales bacterium]
MNPSEPVWITGVGCVSALGSTPREFHDNIFAGRCGIQAIRRFEVPDHPSQIACCLEEVPTPEGWNAQEFAAHQPWEQILIWCASNALRDAGLWEDRQSRRIGLVLGVGGEWIVRWTQDVVDNIGSIYSPQMDELGLARRSLGWLDISGPSTTVAAACASGNYALGVARQWLRQGLVDVCIAGGCEYSVTSMGLAGFGNLGALSRRNHDPAHASRPFDSGRDGFVMGEGGAMMVLESATHARRRGAQGRCEVAGFGASSDAFHAVMPSDDPEPASRAISLALRDARVAPDKVDYVNAHATSTPIGDVHETKALDRVFGDAIGKVAVSSTKSMTGHMLSAASAIEALICLGAIERQAAPPTINLDDIDPACAHLSHVRNVSREQKVAVTVSNSFGFGGSNTSLVLRKIN